MQPSSVGNFFHPVAGWIGTSGGWRAAAVSTIPLVSPQSSAYPQLARAVNGFPTIATVASFLAFALGLARAHAVLDWNTLLLDAIRAENTGPTLATRNLALLHSAIHDAAQSILRTHQPHQFQLEVPGATSAEAAVHGAGHEILQTLYPAFRARADDLLATFLASIPAASSDSNSLSLGRSIARLVLESRSNDGSTTEITYIPSELPGQWRRTPHFFRPPLTPHWGRVRPFCLPSAEPFLLPPPPRLDSAAYARDLDVVRRLGSKIGGERTPEQTLIATFWSDFSYTVMPPGHWQQIAATLARSRRLDLGETARAFALLSLAQADAAIVCWATKYRDNLWRPVTAIRRADDDGNPATASDPSWDSLLPAPPFPAYPSGHSMFSKASSVILTRVLGTDAVTFTTTSDALPGVFRTFESLAACADEVGLSRIYGGIHFPFDNVEGKRAGERIAELVAGRYLLPNHALPLLELGRPSTAGIELRAHGRFKHLLQIESTTDLRHWTPLATVQAIPGGVAHDLRPDANQAGFYRVVELPEPKPETELIPDFLIQDAPGGP